MKERKQAGRGFDRYGVPQKKFRCQFCKKLCGWDFGASDCMPEVCDVCWCKAHGDELDASERGRANALHENCAVEHCKEFKVRT